MSRAITSLGLAPTGLLICLGSFGHSVAGRRALDIGLGRAELDARTEPGQGDQRGLRASGLIGFLHLLTGVWSVLYMKEALWSVSIVLGVQEPWLLGSGRILLTAVFTALP